METEDKTSVKKSILESIMNGKLNQADALETESGISQIEMGNIASRAFSSMMRAEKYAEAAQVSEHFSLPTEKKLEAVSAQFRLYNKKREYAKAIEWGRKYKLPDSEIDNISVKAFNEALYSKDVEKAIRLKKEHNIPHRLIIGEARDWFKVYMDQGKNISALLLGQAFDISRKRTLTAGIWAYQKLLLDGGLPQFMTLEQRFYILTDRDLGQIDQKDWEKFTKVFIDVIIRGLIAKNEIDNLTKIIETLKILVYRGNNPFIGALIRQAADVVAEEHRKLMEETNFELAFKLIDSFHLLSENISLDAKQELVNSAENAHNILIEEDNLQGAKALKENYGLFGKNVLANSMKEVTAVSVEFLERALEESHLDQAKTIISEYGINKNVVLLKADKVLLNKVKSRKFIETFDIIKEIKIGAFSPDLITAATESFHETYEIGQMELSTNIAMHFKIKDHRVMKAAFILWNKSMDKEKYETALEIRKKFKIPRKIIESVVKDTYNMLMVGKQTELASRLRLEYGISLSIWERFNEFLRRLFGGSS